MNTSDWEWRSLYRITCACIFLYFPDGMLVELVYQMQNWVVDRWWQSLHYFPLECEGDILKDPANEPKKNMYVMTVDPEEAPEEPEYVEIGIPFGIPISI